MRLHTYLDRIGVAPPVTADGAGLRALHAGHREAFLFENVAIQSGGRISVQLEDIERKFLDEGSGGYCFEHNTLFASVLRDVGFDPVILLGRVRRGPPDRWCRTHMVLKVPVTGETWLADVGFGALGLVEPIPLREGAVSEQAGLIYSVRREGGLWILSYRRVGAESGSDSREVAASSDLYEFSDDPQTPGDVEVANHYTSTHPDSVFRRTVTIQRATRTERTILRNELLTRYRKGGPVEEQTLSAAERRAAALDVFGVELPAGPLVCDTYAEGV
jgi:N-hydroxyarylamine O-acetyltransferase